MILYKFLRRDVSSLYNRDCVWKVGEWKEHEGRLSICAAGFHASRNPMHAFAYLDVLRGDREAAWARVDVGGHSVVTDDHTKECWSRMRLLAVRPWTESDSEKMLFELRSYAEWSIIREGAWKALVEEAWDFLTANWKNRKSLGVQDRAATLSSKIRQDSFYPEFAFLNERDLNKERMLRLTLWCLATIAHPRLFEEIALFSKRTRLALLGWGAAEQHLGNWMEDRFKGASVAV